MQVSPVAAISTLSLLLTLLTAVAPNGASPGALWSWVPCMHGTARGSRSLWGMARCVLGQCGAKRIWGQQQSGGKSVCLGAHLVRRGLGGEGRR